MISLKNSCSEIKKELGKKEISSTESSISTAIYLASCMIKKEFKSSSEWFNELCFLTYIMTISGQSSLHSQKDKHSD